MKSRLFYFNPTNEMAIANGQVSYMPPRHLHHFEMDLAALPWILSTKDDFILVKKKEGNSLEHLTPYGWELPTMISAPEDLPEQARDKLWFSPWGWSPAVYRHFREFIPLAHPSWISHPFAQWRKTLTELLSRDTGYQLLQSISEIKKEDSLSYSLISLPQLPLEIMKEENLPDILKKHSPPLIIKTPFSASGRGLFRIRSTGDAPEKSPWVKGMLKRQGKVYVERMLNKIQDISFQFHLCEDKISFLGYNYFYADPSGQFAGCAIGKPDVDSTLFRDENRIKEAIQQATVLLKKGLKKINLHKKYTGPAGIDGIFFENEQGALRLQPCLEINMRYNMGYANVLFKPKLHPEAKGKWKTGVFTHGEWPMFCQQETETNPPVTSDGKLLKGFVPFVDPSADKLFGAWLTLK